MVRLHSGMVRLPVYSLSYSLLTMRIVTSVSRLLRRGSFENAFQIRS
jgi:hypothetical protein